MKVKGTDHPDASLRIGELAASTGTSPRSLRYYEEQGLLEPDRESNRYRTYAPDAVCTVRTIRTLLAAGLSTDTIAQVLPCARDGLPLHSCDRLVRLLGDEITGLDERVGALQESRALLASILTDARPEDADRAA